jgi:putative ABC transport system permease protein
MIQSIIDEFRDAARQLRHRPGYTLGAVLSLALGMSLATAVFSVVIAALRPVPFPEPDRLVVFWEEGRDARSMAWSRVPPRHFLALRTEATTIRELASWRDRYTLLGESGAARAVNGVAVTENFFAILRAGAMLGRVFTHDDRDAKVVVLSHALWSSQFGSDRGIVGRAVRIGGIEHSVIGVMGPKFDFPQGTRVWYLVHDDKIAREAATPIIDNDLGYSVLGRLSPGATVELAAAEAGTLYGRLYGDHAERRLMTTRASTLGDWLNRGMRGALALWGMAASFILVLCAVNFATMSLSRGMRRRGEIAVRAAMGATQARLVRASIVEAFLLAIASGALSVVFASWLLAFANVWFANGALPVDAIISWPVIAFGVVATVVVGFLFALAPAIELAKVDLRQILAGDSTSVTARRGEMRGRRALVALQLSFALAGVAVVAAIIKADKRFQAWEVGLDYEQLVLGDLHGPPRPEAQYSFWAFPADSTAIRVTPGPVLERLRASPGVSDAAIIAGGRRLSAFFPSGEIDKAYWSEMRATPNLFEVLGVKLLAGRMPTPEERSSGNVYVASDAFARRYAPSIQDAVGLKVVIHRGVRRPKETVTIVGVVPSYGGSGLWALSSSVYLLEDPQPTRFATVVARVQGDPQVHANGMARNLAGLDARILVSNVSTAKARVDAAQGATRGRKIFLSAVAALALVLAVIGVYSLTSYTTEMRMREFGIRVALGAGTQRLIGAVFSDLWWMATVGVGVGILVGGRLTAYLDNMYRNPMMSNPLIVLPVGQVVACAVTLVVILIVATAVPMRRVLRMDVMRTVQGSG